ncbi:hypothetical protein VULLAG_LOCUS11943 [Vulpes lagopus]
MSEFVLAVLTVSGLLPVAKVLPVGADRGKGTPGSWLPRRRLGSPAGRCRWRSERETSALGAPGLWLAGVGERGGGPRPSPVPPPPRAPPRTWSPRGPHWDPLDLPAQAKRCRRGDEDGLSETSRLRAAAGSPPGRCVPCAPLAGSPRPAAPRPWGPLPPRAPAPAPAPAPRPGFQGAAGLRHLLELDFF